MAQAKTKTDVTTVAELISLILSGIPWVRVESFLRATGFTQQELADFLAVPLRTLARRREAGRLSPEDSERFNRLSEIWKATSKLFNGDRDATRSWLVSPVRGLNNFTPMEFARTEVGGREVLNLLGRLEHGVFS